MDTLFEMSAAPDSTEPKQAQVLARKWRPRDFSTLVGQTHVVRALKHALDTQRLHHAYLFTGTRGVGKTTIARILAKSVNCETGISSTPCGQCSTCRQIEQGRFVDLVELDAATNTGVDNMRALLENAAYAPTSGRYKVYVIDEVHMLSTGAFNAMLKTLEEPPAHILFVLATTDPQKVPVTVLSRCLQFNLKSMPPESISEHLAHVLNEERVPHEPTALAVIAHAAHGSMRDALSLTDQAIAFGAGELKADDVRAMLGAVDDSHLHAILNALADQDGVALMRCADDLAARSIPAGNCLQSLATLAYRLSVLKKVPSAIPEHAPDRQACLALAERFDADTLQVVYQVAVHARAELVWAPDEATGFGMALLRMLAFVADSGASTVGQAQSEPAPKKSAPQPLPVARPQMTERAAAPVREHSASVDPSPLAPALGAMPLAPSPAVASVPKIHVDDTPPEGSAVPAAPKTLDIGFSHQAMEGFPNAQTWPTLAAGLPASGLVKQCLAVTEWVGAQSVDGAWRITLKVPIKTYTEGTMPSRVEALLQTALSSVLDGKPIRLVMEVGQAQHTAHAVQTAEKAERQKSAEESIAQDPFMQQLNSTFGAQIVPGSIRPL